MFFKKRKSRKQLLEDIEKLEFELNALKEYKFEAEKKNIITLRATCISRRRYDDIEDVKKCICRDLSEKLLPYVTVERYPYIDGYCDDEVKYYGDLKIVERY